jgi:hypothetical protein
MNLENFRKDYLKVITKSTVDADLRDYVRLVVEDTLTEGDTREPLASTSTELSDIMDRLTFKKMTDQDYMGFAGVESNNAFMTEYGDFTIIVDGNDIIVIPFDAEQAGFQQKNYQIVFDSVIE